MVNIMNSTGLKSPRRVAILVVCVSSLARAVVAEDSIPSTGPTSDAVSGIDSRVRNLMRKWNVPGAAVAVSKEGRIVYSRGFGWADVEKKRPVEPNALFRLASISKPITAAVIMRLEEMAKLTLDDPIVKYIGKVKPLDSDATVDPRFDQITIKQCLQHTAGFDRDESEKSFDPMFFPKPLAELTDPPADAMTVIRFMRGCPLDFEPGERYAYSNFGYCLLGRVIEKVTGKGYERAARELILIPAGATEMRIGSTRKTNRLPKEVCCYDYPGAKKTRSIFPGVKGEVPNPYGQFYLEAMDSHGAWVGSAPNLLRFVAALEGKGRKPILRGETFKTMITTRVPSKGENRFYALGWSIVQIGDGDDWKNANWYHNGSLPGTWTILVRAYNGLSWAFLVNTRPEKSEGFSSEADRMMWRAVRSVEEWGE